MMQHMGLWMRWANRALERSAVDAARGGAATAAHWQVVAAAGTDRRLM
jgi:hypothetical protein